MYCVIQATFGGYSAQGYWAARFMRLEDLEANEVAVGRGFKSLVAHTGDEE